jgi:hypothetical protein
MLERTDAITNEVLDPATFLLAYSAVLLACVGVLALFTRYAKRMRRVILSFVACPAVPYFSMSHNLHDFGGKVFLT